MALFSRASFAELGAVDDLDAYKPVTLYSKVTKQTASSCLHHALFCSDRLLWSRGQHCVYTVPANMLHTKIV